MRAPSALPGKLRGDNRREVRGARRSAGCLARHHGCLLAERDRAGEEHLVEALAGRHHGQADVWHLEMHERCICTQAGYRRVGCSLQYVGLQAGAAHHAEVDQGGTALTWLCLLWLDLLRTTRKSTRMGPVALTKRSTAPGSSSTVEQRKDSMPYACLGVGLGLGLGLGLELGLGLGLEVGLGLR